MLVKIRDEGSALVSVLVIMLVLTITGLALAAIVTNTTSGLAGSRDTAQSRAAADAGLATGLAEAKRTGQACGMDIASTTPPKFRVTSVCGSGRVTFTVTGTGENGGRTKTEATFSYSSGTAGTGADMIFFGDTTFTHETITNSIDSSLLSIVIPSGDFTCMAPIPANIIVAGNLSSTGGCTIEGSVVAGGTAQMSVGSDRIEKSLTTTGTADNRVQQVGGDIHIKGGANFGWNGNTIGGKVTSGGSVSLGSTKIAGSLTLPKNKTFKQESGSVAGGVAYLDSVTPPTAPTFAKWFDYKYALTDWQPYAGATFTPRTLTASGSGDKTCAYFNSYPADGWKSLGAATTPTILDARACPNLSSNSGTSPIVELKSDLVLLAKSYDLTSITFTAAPGVTTPPRVWFIVEDTVDDDAVTCAGGAGNIKINGTRVTTAITAMAYTPCTIDIAGMNNDTWKGSFYGGKFNYGGGIQFYGSPIALPGMPSSPTSTIPSTPSGGTIGALISQRDIP